MQFASLTFLFLFFPMTLGLYRLVPHRWKREAMLVISVLFLLGGGLLSAGVLLLLTALMFFAGWLMERWKSRKGGAVCCSPAWCWDIWQCWFCCAATGCAHGRRRT